MKNSEWSDPSGRPPPPSPSEMPADRELALAFAPVHKRAFGIAIGTALAVAVLLATAAAVVLDPAGGFNMELLAEYFAGYSLSWTGAVIGAAWAFFVGFVAGWFTAFVRNLVVAAWVFLVRTRAELAATREFLDHI
jgi:hypothetical protein